jgi:hypothetical protein
MFGSLLYKSISTAKNPIAPQQILTCVLAFASLSFFIPGRIRDERITLWCFCLFEVCCGFYYPVMASLKGKLIDDGSRASIYGILRVPLNAFVVLALSTTKEGERLRHHPRNGWLTPFRRSPSRYRVHDVQCFIGCRCYCCAQSPCMRRLVVGWRLHELTYLRRDGLR